jgi:hypothetical protein
MYNASPLFSTDGKGIIFMKKILLVASIFLCACAHKPVSVSFGLPEEAKTISIPVEDLRPENEKIKTDLVFSTQILSKQYAIYRVGDETTIPPITDVFRWRVFERLGKTEKNLKISVYHMVAYLNMKSQLRRHSVGFAIGGLLGSAIATSTVASTVNISQSLVDREQFDRNGGKLEARRAFYSEEENPGKASVFVIYIDAAINDKRVFVRTMAPLTASEGQYPFVPAVNGAIQYWLDQYQSNQ